MADPWVLLLAGSTLVIVGFLAAQLFDRYRVPDYFVLMSLGILLGSGFVPIVGPDTRTSLVVVAPVLTNMALAFILFEGGLALRARGAKGAGFGVVGHTVLAMAISSVGVWYVGTRLLGLNDLTSVVLAAAFIGPSAAIVLSVLPSLSVGDRTRIALTLEGVLGNILAVAVILLFVRFPGFAPDPTGLAVYAAYVSASAALGAALGFLWHRGVGAVRPRNFSFMTSVALALFLYAIGEGLLSGTGGVAAFTFGLVLGRRGTLAVNGQVAPPGAPGARGLPEFHREIVFLLRTFFFLYLGLRIDVSRIGLGPVLGSAAFVAVFLASRVPSTAILSRAWRLPRLDARILRAVVARGMTDTVLVLYAIDVGVVEPAKAEFVTQLLFLVVLLAATVSAVLVSLAERRETAAPRPHPAAVPRPAGPSIAAVVAPPPGSIRDPIDDPLPEIDDPQVD